MTVPDWLAWVAQDRPRSVFTVEDDDPVTYADLVGRVRAVAGALRTHGVAPGDRVAVLQRNGLGFAVDFLAAMWAGAVPAPVSWRSSTDEWAYVVAHSRAGLVLTEADFAEPLVRALGDRAAGFVVSRGSANAPGVRDHRQWLQDREQDVDRPAARASADAYQIYTSGTTSRPKGVVCSHAALMACVQQIGHLHRSAGVLGGRLLASPPMFHSGITVHWLTTTVYGGEVHFLRDFDASSLMTALAERRIELTMLMPTMLELVMRGAERTELSALKLVVYGGQSIAPDTFRRARDWFGSGFLQLYGLTETNPATALTPEDHEWFATHPELPVPTGRPIPGTEIEVRSPEGRRLPSGSIGELLIRCPQQMTCYWADPEKTAEVSVDGWIRSGDSGWVDERGYVHVEGRVDDMIVSGAENIFPVEVEDVVASCPGVAEAVVVGLPHDVWGQQVTAAVVWESAPGDPADVIAHCRRHLPGYKCPKKVHTVEALPRNATGKVLRRQVAAVLTDSRADVSA